MCKFAPLFKKEFIKIKHTQDEKNNSIINSNCNFIAW